MSTTERTEGTVPANTEPEHEEKHPKKHVDRAFHPEKHRDHTVAHPASTGVTHLDPGTIHI